MSYNTVAFIQLLYLQLCSVQPTKLTLITKQVVSLKHFTAVYQGIETFKITIFFTILDILLDLLMMIHFYGRNKLLGFKVFDEPQIETFFMVYLKQIKYNNASRVVVVSTFLLRMCLLSSIFLL